MSDFERLYEVNQMIEQGRENEARVALIEMLHSYEMDRKDYSPLLNHLVRRVGLYPYMRLESSHWEDRLVVGAFSANVGLAKSVALHRDQSALLAKLLRGESVAVSAPTSFGKSFVIDAFIAMTKPSTVLLIVPTISLMDEVRRRLYRKFGNQYAIVTTTDVDVPQKNVIFVFPQERAVTYANKIKELDLFIVDEFYKASASFDKDRSPTLVRAMIKYSSIARQRYFLAPNIAALLDNPFTKGMEFVKTDFSTVVLKMHDLSGYTAGSVERKTEAAREVCVPGVKALLYAGSHAQVAVASAAVMDLWPKTGAGLLDSMGEWFEKNYSPTWILASLIRRRIGLHNGQIHRSVSQIQVRLFEDFGEGIDLLVSTSSIIEGVNTSAQRVIVWSNRNGTPKLKNFDFRNLVGRGGRMFKYFVGEVYLLEAAPQDDETQLSLEMPESLLGIADLDSVSESLTDIQKSRAEDFDRKVSDILNIASVAALQREGKLQSSDANFVWKLVTEISKSPDEWRSLAHLNSKNRENWNWVLFNAINMSRAGWDCKFTTVVAFVKVLADSWTTTIPAMLSRLESHNVSIEDFFKLERIVSYKLASLLGDINTIHARLSPGRGFDISPFVFKLSHAFLPPVVYQLEEYGLPRMLSRRIHDAALVDFEDADLTLASAISRLRDASPAVYGNFDSLAEHFILDHFYSGVTVSDHSKSIT